MSETDFVTISSGDLTARINPFGAELSSLADRRGREFVFDGDPAFWTGHAPLLFPIVGALNGERLRVGAQEYKLPRHGFARRSRFEVLEVSGAEARFRLRDSEETRAVFPFAFALEMAFRLDGATLHMTASVRNPGEQVLPFSFGYHPAFAWPLPGKAAKADHVIIFDKTEPKPIRRLDPAGGLLLPGGMPTPVEGRNLALDASLFDADAVIWDDLASRSLIYGAPGATQLAIAFPDMPMLGLWQKVGAPFLCIEPWQGHSDPVGFAGQFRDKPGIVELAAGETGAFRMDVTVLSAD